MMASSSTARIRALFAMAASPSLGTAPEGGSCVGYPDGYARSVYGFHTFLGVPKPIPTGVCNASWQPPCQDEGIPDVTLRPQAPIVHPCQRVGWGVEAPPRVQRDGNGAPLAGQRKFHHGATQGEEGRKQGQGSGEKASGGAKEAGARGHRPQGGCRRREQADRGARGGEPAPSRGDRDACASERTAPAPDETRADEHTRAPVVVAQAADGVSIGRSQRAVCEPRRVATAAGGPHATTVPPPAPPSGPRSTIQSASLTMSRLCSMVTTRVPEVDQAVQHGDQALDVGEVEAGGRLVEHVERLRRVIPWRARRRA